MQVKYKYLKVYLSAIDSKYFTTHYYIFSTRQPDIIIILSVSIQVSCWIGISIS